MKRLLFCLATVILLTISGCSNASDKNASEVNETNFEFTGTIEEINDTKALVKTNNDVLKEGDSSESEVIVDLSVNSEQSFQIGNEIKVEAGEVILDSDPRQVDTISVELVE